jgi:hypothetical protein
METSMLIATGFSWKVPPFIYCELFSSKPQGFLPMICGLCPFYVDYNGL